jgi:hypothetical protein
MSKNAGELLWNRQRINIDDETIDVDTGITQVDRSFGDMSLNEPTFGNPSRIQVIPLAPTSEWIGLTHGEPFFNSATGTIHVLFQNNSDTTFNVLFWDPHSILGPGQADFYLDIG